MTKKIHQLGAKLAELGAAKEFLMIGKMAERILPSSHMDVFRLTTLNQVNPKGDASQQNIWDTLRANPLLSIRAGLSAL